MPTSGLRVWRIKNLIHKQSFLSVERATLSTTVGSPSEPLNICLQGLYALIKKTKGGVRRNNISGTCQKHLWTATDLSGIPGKGDPFVMMGDCLLT